MLSLKVGFFIEKIILPSLFYNNLAISVFFCHLNVILVIFVQYIVNFKLLFMKKVLLFSFIMFSFIVSASAQTKSASKTQPTTTTSTEQTPSAKKRTVEPKATTVVKKKQQTEAEYDNDKMKANKAAASLVDERNN